MLHHHDKGRSTASILPALVARQRALPLATCHKEKQAWNNSKLQSTTQAPPPKPIRTPLESLLSRRYGHSGAPGRRDKNKNNKKTRRYRILPYLKKYIFNHGNVNFDKFVKSRLIIVFILINKSAYVVTPSALKPPAAINRWKSSSLSPYFF